MKELVKTEVPGIYRDIKSKALIIKSDPVQRELMKKIRELEMRIRVLEEKINTNKE